MKGFGMDDWLAIAALVSTFPPRRSTTQAVFASLGCCTRPSKKCSRCKVAKKHFLLSFPEVIARPKSCQKTSYVMRWCA
jgi:hypothetical protein